LIKRNNIKDCPTRHRFLNPSCEGLVVSMTTEENKRDGLPIDFFDQCVINEKDNVDGELQKWLSRFTNEIIRD
jgi:hypothetical protein